MNKQFINAVVIVEGKTDTAKLQKLFNVETIETNGTSLNKKKIDEIIKISKTKDIILFLDPDGPGEQIRKKITQYVPNCYNCFINKKDIMSNKKNKIGIAEANDESIYEAFKNIKKFDNQNQSLSWEEYISLDLSNKLVREMLCNKIGISYCNHKQLYKRLNMLNYDKIKIETLLKK